MRKVLRIAFVLFLAFAAFTTFIPCRYSSYRAVSAFIESPLSAWDDPRYVDCQCNQWYSGSNECSMEFPCEHSSWGCGPLWTLACNGVYVESWPQDPPIPN